MKLFTTTLLTATLLAFPTFAQTSGSSSSSGANAETNINFGGTNAPGVSAPGISISVGSCATSGSAGVSMAGFGIVVGGTKVDAKCNTRQDMLVLHGTGMGQRVVAMRGCADEDIARAFAAAGHPCPATAHASYRPTYTIPQAVQELNNGQPIWDVAQNRWRYR